MATGSLEAFVFGTLVALRSFDFMLMPSPGRLRIIVYACSSISLTNALSHRASNPSREQDCCQLTSALQTALWLLNFTTVLALWALWEFFHNRLSEAGAFTLLYLCWVLIITAHSNVTWDMKRLSDERLGERAPEIRRSTVNTGMAGVVAMFFMGALGFTLFYGVVRPRDWKFSRHTRQFIPIPTLSWFLGVPYYIANFVMRKFWIATYIFCCIPFLNFSVLVFPMVFTSVVIGMTISSLPLSFRPFPPPISQTGAEPTPAEHEENLRRFMDTYGEVFHACIVVFLLIITAEQTVSLNRPPGAIRLPYSPFTH